MKTGETQTIEVWIQLNSGEVLTAYTKRSAVLYYSNGVSNKILAVYVESLTGLTPPKGADWAYKTLTVDTTAFTDSGINYAGKLTLAVPATTFDLVPFSGPRKPQVFIEAIVSNTSKTLKTEQLIPLEDLQKSISHGIEL